ncbi:SPOR domain-containing protein [Sphingomonas sp. Leaf25]|uniref:SPOR domain-containing protein n=1 Tax=Sphingomonas sp. Leaf25 TaxID=1735692 RepID=UPI0006FE7356|nr:SPOR domain-containing protein [Sphingomonas sp. Leaf25]KQN06893.1 sporulation protein [Sphingomonas sp. Leaf25]
MADTFAPGGDSDQDRLPWLESADPEPEPAAPIWRTVLLVLIGLLSVAAIAFALLRHQTTPTASGTGDLIAAPAEPYKTRPQGTDGMQVAGNSDTAIATSEGATGNASVNLGAVPETPVDSRPVAQPKAATNGTARVEAAVPSATQRLEARAPATAAPAAAAAGAGGSVVQLGSFPAEGAANAAWNQLSRRFGYLAPLGKSVQAAEVKGRTVYRLRVNAGSANQATDLCGKLKLAGENCFIAR